MGRAELERAALELADQGRSIFPAVPGGKIPAVAWGSYQQQRATTEQVRAWWKRTPYNIAVACGPISDLVVLDVDRRHGGYESFPALDLPDTRTVATPNGFHFWFSWPAGADLRSSAGKIAPGVDLRAAGGYAICPPSERPDGTYCWLLDAGPAEPLAELPDWLAVASAAPARTTTSSNGTTGGKGLHSGRVSDAYLNAALTGILADLASARRGTRNNTLFRCACRVAELVEAGAPEQWFDRLAAAGRRVGLPGAEVDATIASGRAGWRPR